MGGSVSMGLSTRFYSAWVHMYLYSPEGIWWEALYPLACPLILLPNRFNAYHHTHLKWIWWEAVYLLACPLILLPNRFNVPLLTWRNMMGGSVSIELVHWFYSPRFNVKSTGPEANMMGGSVSNGLSTDFTPGGFRCTSDSPRRVIWVDRPVDIYWACPLILLSCEFRCTSDSPRRVIWVDRPVDIYWLVHWFYSF